MGTRTGSTSSRRPTRVLICGCGLMGGSLALALLARGRRYEVSAIDRPAVLRRARRLGIADAGTTLAGLPRALPRLAPDVIVLALPLPAIAAALPGLARACRALTPARRPLVVDLGSVKADVVVKARALGLPRFVGGHPMTGRERGGIEQASAELYRGAKMVLCDEALGRGAAARGDRRQAAALARAIGAVPTWLDARTHDRVVALVSHLPHLVALALMARAERLAARLHRTDVGLPLALAAGSFRDATRVAAADPAIWRPIFAHNRREIRAALEGLIAELGAQVAAIDRCRDAEDPPAGPLSPARLRTLGRRRTALAERLAARR